MAKSQVSINNDNAVTTATLTGIGQVIRETKIVVFSPHYDDFLFMMGGYVGEMARVRLLHTKEFHINLLFSKSNYLARTGRENADNSLERIKHATGKRLLEDQQCLDELLGAFNYRYELMRERECLVRGKLIEDGDMEFPHGMYPDFNAEDIEIFARMKDRIREWAQHPDTALVFPIAFKEHIDHFITREAAITVAKELGERSAAAFYFQEDKPYGGIADAAEQERIAEFIRQHHLEALTYEYDPEAMIDLAFKHYVTQVEEIYKTGIRNRARRIQDLQQAARPCDRIYKYNGTHSSI